MKIALFGNPNTGKSSIFNFLTGLKQHVGNFPGVTVEKKSGDLKLGNNLHTVIDFPGTYSIYPRSIDEQIVYQVLTNKAHPDFPDLALVVVDASNLERNLFLFTQIYDLGIPAILVLNMSDMASRKGQKIDVDCLKQNFPFASIVETNARVGFGVDRLKNAIQNFEFKSGNQNFLENFKVLAVDDENAQSREAELRYTKINTILPTIIKGNVSHTDVKSNKIDKILIHPIWGYFIFALILLLLFQLIYSFAAIPMDFIDSQFANFSAWLKNSLPEGNFSSLISQGIIPGIGGIIVFIPQIALLFFFLAILDESGYLARVVFIMDKLMRPLGLNGKSVVPLLSSVACAIPGIMAARTISNQKERLITIFVSPLMSCSARIPVYTMLITLVIPSYKVFGFINLQGLVLFGLYFMGIFTALLTAAIMKYFIRSREKSFLLMELPTYKKPRWGNVIVTVLEKIKVFVLDAGKIIMAISVILWALASFGGGEKTNLMVEQIKKESTFKSLSSDEQEAKIASIQLENSYMGTLGKAIEPVIRPLGYDWKIGISLITSFAAREVFVGSLATIYSSTNTDGENLPLVKRLKTELRDDGQPVFTLATGVSLMIFYVFAMQCMATLAIVKRETQSWKWPLLQLLFMGFLAYIGAFTAYSILS